MSQTNFYGVMHFPEVAVIRQLLHSWLRVDHLKEDLGLTGEELVYDDEQVYMYAHASTSRNRETFFLLEGHLHAGLEETKDWLQKLLSLCTVQGVKVELEYAAVNEAGEEISDQFTVSAPAIS